MSAPQLRSPYEFFPLMEEVNTINGRMKTVDLYRRTGLLDSENETIYFVEYFLPEDTEFKKELHRSVHVELKKTMLLEPALAEF